ncbi:hypothetical protein GVY41_05070 [Frigidibacter albus]|uniref:Uncharacterized protein n=1 Tax=Frigidibacter albus TaxID=1465486 RepID=A0A6L8VES3_9RHOB|nr:hypothetical protein [Frigidibacter albus]MZQ88815.1 hypothetical protein [Frigidibacter albus]NBE30376.1 hypothetical protein [Frigidibacter albus]GGH50648.1 hypothetical protein GCM10011341_13790 [Frigidibacter albus]
MTPQIVQDLHPPRLPLDYVQLGPPEVLAALGLGLLAALALMALLRPALHRRRPPAEALEAALADLRPLPPQDRLLAQAALLAHYGGTVPPDLRPALYGAAVPDNPTLEPLIRAAARGARHA